MKKAKWAIFLGIIFIVFLALIYKNTEAQTSESGDAIAVRIIPNPNHYSIYRWYDSQGFTGSPQALSVDGYEAVRDGRTVYVNAANIKDKLIYTNIYLISYNQDPSPKTVDILGQIVKNWKFNGDLVETANPGPRCEISSLSCTNDAGCSADQTCATEGIASSSCQLKVPVNCLKDEDCPQNFFCNSVKAKVIRDLARIGKVEELKESLFAYKNSHGSYPRLTAGTYLSGHSISVWPSWQGSFLSELTMAQNLFDPINRLGACPDYDLKTCWNETTQHFVYEPEPGYLMLPSGSYGFVYKTDANGSNYNLCAVMETREATSTLDFQFAPNNPTNSDCVTATGVISGGNSLNTAPYIIDSYLSGEADKEFNGSIRVADREGNPLTWNLNTVATNWSAWSAAPTLQDTGNLNQKKIHAARAGGPGTYNALLTVSDGQGEVLSTTTTLFIMNSKPLVEAENGEYLLNQNQPFSYSFYFSDDNLAVPANAYTLVKVSGPNNFNMLSFPGTITPAGYNRYQVTYQGVIPTTNKFYANTDYFYRVTVVDRYNNGTIKNFKITLKIDAPSLTFNCPNSTRLGKSYSCFLGYVAQGDHDIAYSSPGLPAGLAINIASTTNSYQNNEIDAASLNQPTKWQKILALFKTSIEDASANNIIAQSQPLNIPSSAYLSGTLTAISNSEVIIKATNEYGASTTKSFWLKVNNYCGDGLKQEPNTEGRGGIYNDGYEDCDGTAGVSLSGGQPVVSNSSLIQYGCTTFNSSTPNPIPNGNFCIFKSAIDNGGYCGDGYCQSVILYNGNQYLVENAGNCSADCDPSCQSNCINKICGSDGCGGSCGECSETEICDEGACETKCVPSCVGKNCGLDGCGGTCGSCSSSAFDCINGVCTSTCTPQCLGRTCGQDGCGGFCAPNNCPPQTECRNGNCRSTCVPNCVGRTCGNDGCGGSCGTCTFPTSCTTNGVCCQADCAGCLGLFSTASYQICGGACCNPDTQMCCNDSCIPINSICTPYY